MRILVLSERFWPETDPRAIRWGAICREWGNAGNEVRVLCGPGRDATTSLPGVEIHRLGGRWTRNVTTGAPAERKSPSPWTAWRTAGWSFVRNLRDLTWKKLWWPDYACLWQQRAATCARAMAEWTPDALVTVSNPYSSHLAGLRVRSFWPHARWLADIGDPFSLPNAPAVNHRTLYEAKNRRLEQRVFEQADVLSVTTEATARAYRAELPIGAAKLVVIPPLVDKTLCAAALSPPQETLRQVSGTQRIVYCGRLYAKLRGPGPILAAFAHFVQEYPLPRWEMHLYGPVDECRTEIDPWRTTLGDRLIVHGAVPRAEAWRAMQQADVLLNVGNDNPCQLPSKLVEYVSLGKPILNVAVRSDDTSAEFLAGYPAAISLLAEVQSSNSEAYGRMCKFLKQLPPVPNADLLRQFLAPHQPAAIAERYLQLLAPTSAPITAPHFASYPIRSGATE
jgi:glycosyltransferase involved in cell wall biosynthesis